MRCHLQCSSEYSFAAPEDYPKTRRSVGNLPIYANQTFQYIPYMFYSSVWCKWSSLDSRVVKSLIYLHACLKPKPKLMMRHDVTVPVAHGNWHATLTSTSSNLLCQEKKLAPHRYHPTVGQRGAHQSSHPEQKKIYMED